jgi:hypothetical protein
VYISMQARTLPKNVTGKNRLGEVLNASKSLTVSIPNTKLFMSPGGSERTVMFG